MLTQKFILPQCTAEITAFEQQETCFVTAGGRRPDLNWLQKAAAGYTVYCADAGGAYCLEAGIMPQRLYGDGDSAGAEVYKKLAAQGTNIFQYPPAKDDTDLQLVLQQCTGCNLIVSGIWGGRFDHLYSNVFSLLGYKAKHGCQVIMADEQEVMLLLQDSESVHVSIDKLQNVKAVSLLPLSNEVQVNIAGVRWPLQQAQLQLLYPYAISNEPLGDFTCDCLAGAVGLYLCFTE